MTKYRSTLYATSFGGVLLSFAAFFAIRQQESTNFDKEFKVECENRIASIHREVESDLSGLSALRAFVHTSPLDQARFVGFAGEILRVHSSIRALEWVPKVKSGERRSFEQRLASSNGITEGSPAHPVRAGMRDEFFPVEYLYPRAGNDNAVGFYVFCPCLAASLAAMSPPPDAPQT